jgi:hypothetical protein
MKLHHRIVKETKTKYEIQYNLPLSLSIITSNFGNEVIRNNKFNFGNEVIIDG